MWHQRALNGVLDRLYILDQQKHARAARLLRHYLTRTGMKVVFDVGEFDSSSVVQQALAKNRGGGLRASFRIKLMFPFQVEWKKSELFEARLIKRDGTLAANKILWRDAP